MTMTTEQVLHEMEAAGAEQNRKIYRRHGAGDNQFGVSFAFMDALEKRLKREKDPDRDHAMALDLWATGNQDARILATRLADPAQMVDALLNAWARDVDNYGLADAFGNLAARSPHARALAYHWIDADGEWIETAGWNVLGHLVSSGALMDDECAALLRRIEAEIHTAKNRVRYSMNMIVIAIGLRPGSLYGAAMSSARTIGPVIVDHGQTGCKTPDAASYIEKTLAHRAKKAAPRV